MKYMAISDIHGSFPALKKAIECFQNEQPDNLLILGDILYHGPRNDLPNGYQPREVVRLLQSIKNKLICVRGNCDAEVDEMVLGFPIGAEYAVVDCENIKILLTHGHKLDTTLKDMVNGFDVVLSGHTHVAGVQKKDGVWFVNPGSISIPKENTLPGYAIFENGNVILKTLDGIEYLKQNLKDN